MIGRINCSKHSLRSKMCHRWEVCLLSKTCSLIAMQWVCQFTGHSLAFAKNIIILTAWLSCDKPQLNEKIYYHILHNAKSTKYSYSTVYSHRHIRLLLARHLISMRGIGNIWYPLRRYYSHSIRYDN